MNEETKKIVCKNFHCSVDDCPYNYTSGKFQLIPNVIYDPAHLEDNPKYCKKANWYGNRVDENDVISQD